MWNILVKSKLWDLKFTETQMGMDEFFLTTYWRWDLQQIDEYLDDRISHKIFQ